MNKKRNIYSVTEDEVVAWYDGDKLHREDGPAVIHSNGDKHWWYEDQPHREDGPASEFADGDQMWFIHGAPHRLDGPAIIMSSKEFGYHPITSHPIAADKDKIIEWWVNGEKIPCSTQEEFEKIMKLKVFW